MSLFAVNCDVDPRIPFEGWRIANHQRGGLLDLTKTKIVPFYSTCQQEEKSISGGNLLAELAGQNILNANVLDFLLDHPDMIPEEWKWKKVYGSELYFWGTIFFDENRDKYVCCLRRLVEGGGWCRGAQFIGSTFFPHEATAVSQ